MKIVLTVTAILLVVATLRAPVSVTAQGRSPDIYIEPGFRSLHKPDGSQQVQGKLVIGRNTGDIWGFPTLSGARIRSILR